MQIRDVILDNVIDEAQEFLEFHSGEDIEK